MIQSTLVADGLERVQRVVDSRGGAGFAERVKGVRAIRSELTPTRKSPRFSDICALPQRIPKTPLEKIGCAT